jgi:MATE family multidrug resistance protein
MEMRDEYRSLLRLGSPVLASQLGAICVGFADTMMVGAYGVNELAAAAFVNSLFFIATVAIIGFAAGLTPLVGALYGVHDFHKAGQTLRAGLEVNILVSLGVAAIMALLYLCLGHMGQPDELMPLIRRYYMLVMLSLVPTSLFCTFQQTANGCNDTTMPMCVVLSANVLNIIGNYALIFGHFGCPELGLAGAGISTVCAYTLQAIAIVAIMLCSKRYKEIRDGFRHPGEYGRMRMTVVRTSFPVMIQTTVECSLWTLGAIVCGWFGKIQLASYQVVNTLGRLGFMTYMSFSTAVAIRVANHTGRHDVNAIRTTTGAGLHLNIALAITASLILAVWGDSLTGMFTKDTAVIGNAAGLIPLLILYQFCDAAQLTFANALRGTSVVRPLLYVALVSYILIGTPVMLWMADICDMGNRGVYWAFNIALAIAAMMLWISLRRALRQMEEVNGK